MSKREDYTTESQKSPSQESPQGANRRHARIVVTPESLALTGPGTTFVLCAKLAESAGPTHPWAWPKLATLAHELGISTRKARGWLDAAKARGAVTTCRRGFPRASLGFDLRAFFVAMGFPEAAAIPPPAEARFHLSPTQEADLRAAMEPNSKCGKTRRQSAGKPDIKVRENPALSTEHLTEQENQQQGTAVVERAHALGEEQGNGQGAESTRTERCSKCPDRAGERCGWLGESRKEAARWCAAVLLITDRFDLPVASALSIVRERPLWTEEDWEEVLPYGWPDDLAEQVQKARNPGGFLCHALRTSGDEWLRTGRMEQARQQQLDRGRQRQKEADQQRAEKQKRQREASLATYRARWAKVGLSPDEIERRAAELRESSGEELDSAPGAEHTEGPRVIGRVSGRHQNTLLLEGSDPEALRLFLAMKGRILESEVTLSLFGDPEPPAAWWPKKLRVAQSLATQAAEWSRKGREEAITTIRNLRYAQQKVKCVERRSDLSAYSYESYEKIKAELSVEVAGLSFAEVLTLARRAKKDATPLDLIAFGERPPDMAEQDYRERQSAFTARYLDLLRAAPGARQEVKV